MEGTPTASFHTSRHDYLPPIAMPFRNASDLHGWRRLAYRLDNPEHFRIHNVFTVAQLELVNAAVADSFDRKRPTHAPSGFRECDTDNQESYYIERLLDRRAIKQGRTRITQYLVKWEGYGPQHDDWRTLKELSNATTLVKEYEESLRPDTAATAPATIPPPRRPGRSKKAFGSSNTLCCCSTGSTCRCPSSISC